MRNRPTNEQFIAQLQNVVDTLRREIVSGKYAYHDFLPSELEQSKRFGLSNKSVRKAMDILVEEGWIEKIPRVGSRVILQPSPVKLTLACNTITFRNLELIGLLNDFQQQYPWISIDAQEWAGAPGFHRDGIGQFDIVVADSFQFQQLVETGLARDLEPQPVNPEIFPILNKQFYLDEHLLLMPIVFSPIVLVYNKAHFREQGLPEPDGSWTWDDLMTVAEQLSNGKEKYGFCFRAQDVNRWPIFLLQSGERFEWDGERPKSIQGTRMLDSLRLFRKIVHNRKASPLYLSDNNEDINQMFLKGNLSMVMTSYFGLNSFRHTDLEFDVSPIPFIYEPRTLLICLGAGISRYSKNQDAAALFIRYLTSARGRSFIHRHTLSIPSSRLPSDISAEDRLNRPDRYALYREMVFSYRTHRDLNLTSPTFPEIFNSLKAYLAYMIDEDELCERINQVLLLQ